MPNAPRWEDLQKLIEAMTARRTATSVWWSEQLTQPNQLAPGGLLGPAVDALPASSWDDGATEWDGGETRWDEPVHALNHPVWTDEDIAASFRDLREQTYLDESWRIIEGEVLHRHRFECFGCDKAGEAITVRPAWYSQNKDGSFDFMCRSRHHLLIPLCDVCCDAHDELYDGRGLPEKGPYIR